MDSRPGIVGCVAQTLADFGYAPATPARIEQIIGPPLQLGFAGLIGERGGDPAAAAACVRRYRELYPECATSWGTVLQPGIVEALERLERVATLAVATSKPVRFAEPILAALGLRRYFEVVAGPPAGDETESKTDTLRRAMRGVGARAVREAPQAYLIGDRHYDVVAALACGIVPVGATWGFGSETELRGAGAVLIAHAPSELQTLIAPSPQASHG